MCSRCWGKWQLTFNADDNMNVRHKSVCIARVCEVNSRKCRNSALSSWLQLSLLSKSMAIDCSRTVERLGRGSEDFGRTG